MREALDEGQPPRRRAEPIPVDPQRDVVRGHRPGRQGSAKGGQPFLVVLPDRHRARGDVGHRSVMAAVSDHRVEPGEPVERREVIAERIGP